MSPNQWFEVRIRYNPATGQLQMSCPDGVLTNWILDLAKAELFKPKQGPSVEPAPARFLNDLN